MYAHIHAYTVCLIYSYTYFERNDMFLRSINQYSINSSVYKKKKKIL